jgi:hypothetical protein
MPSQKVEVDKKTLPVNKSFKGNMTVSINNDKIICSGMYISSKHHTEAISEEENYQ